MHIFLFSDPIYIHHLGKFSFQFEGVMLVIRVQLFFFFFCGMIYFSSHSIYDWAYLAKQKKCVSIPDLRWSERSLRQPCLIIVSFISAKFHLISSSNQKFGPLNELVKKYDYLN